jgi:hypothetical protein
VTPAELERSEADLLAATAEGRPPGEDMEVERFGDAVLVLGPPDSPLLRVTGLCAEAPLGDELDRVERRNVGRDLPSRVDLSPYAHPSLRQALAERGYRVASFRQVMTAPLPANAPPVALPEGFASRRVRKDHPADVRATSLAIGRGFSDGSAPPPWALVVGAQVIESPLAATFVVEHRGERVAGATVTVARGVAWLSGASVLPEFRRLGLHRALVAIRLGHALLHGASGAAMHASPGAWSERTAARAGFAVRYTKPTVIRSLP